MPPEDTTTDQLALALRHDADGRWAEAHAIVAARNDALSAWVHAYLHRVEGDLGNARYWYARASQPPRTGPLGDERNELLAAIKPASAR